MNVKRNFLLIALFILAASFVAGNVQAQTNAPGFLPFQALLSDAADNPLTSTAVSMVIQITNASSGCVLYQETQSGTTDSKGMIAFAVGSGSAPSYATGI